MEIPDYSDPIYSLDPRLQELAFRMMSYPDWVRRRLWRMSRAGAHNYRHLFRYQDFNSGLKLSICKAEDAIVESRIYVPSASSFNDPYEFQADAVLTSDPVKRRQFLERGGKQHHLKGKVLQRGVRAATRRAIANPRMIMNVLQQQRDKHGVVCFTKNPRNLLMWSHYSAGHSGIAVMYSPMNDAGFFLQLLPVNYQSEMAKLTWPEDANRILDDVLLRKSDHWRLEEELRFISRTTVNGHFPLYPLCVTGLILGNRFPDSEMPALDNLLKRRHFRGHPPLRLFRADRRQDRYAVYLRALNPAERSLLPHA